MRNALRLMLTAGATSPVQSTRLQEARVLMPTGRSGISQRQRWFLSSFSAFRPAFEGE